jgi:hypothetical protein
MPMIDDTRSELLEALRELVEVCPHVRFGQLVSNLGMLARPQEHGSTYDVEDDELLAAAKQHLESRRKAMTAVA